MTLQCGGQLSEKVRADANDHRQHHHLDAGTDDIAQHPFGKETGAIPQRERHEDEPGQAGQLELEDTDEHLYCEDEEGENDEQQSDQQHRSEEQTSELQSLMRISYAGFCLKKKKKARKS